jgi:hypothetical protein
MEKTYGNKQPFTEQAPNRSNETQNVNLDPELKSICNS